MEEEQSSLLPNIQSNPNTSFHESKRKRKRSELYCDDHHDHDTNAVVKRWRSEREQLIYSSKLIEALRHVRRQRRSRREESSPSTSPSSSPSIPEIRETADRVLAVSAKGKTRWSRAILTSRLRARARLNNNKHKKVKKVHVTGNNRLKMKKMKNNKNEKREKRRLPAVETKLRILSRLVPGCRKLSFSNLLEEATDYIAALEMQVRAMTAITDILAGAPVDRLGFNL